MATLFVFILVILATIFTLFKARKTALTLLCIVIICFFLVSSGFLPNWLTKNLQDAMLTMAPLQWADKNVIVLLGGGGIKLPDGKTRQPNIIAYSRINKAAELYVTCQRRQKVCPIIVSTGDPNHLGETEASIYTRQLVNLGVNPKDIIQDTKSQNTFQNAAFTRKLLTANQYQQALLVTSSLHEKRALIYFAYYGVKPYPVPSDYTTTTEPYGSSIGYQFAITDFALHEYVGIARFYIYNYFHWNE